MSWELVEGVEGLLDDDNKRAPVEMRGLLLKMKFMSIVEEMAEKFVSWEIHKTNNPDSFMGEVKDNLFKLRRTNDKIYFLKKVIDEVSKSAEVHSKECRDEKNCDESKGYRFSLFYLNQELDEYNEIEQSEDENIDYAQRINLNKKIDSLLAELEKLKHDSETIQKGQIIIIEAFSEEFEELKGMYGLGKKNWRQNLFGKFGEMIVSGVVSETISKEVANIMKDMGKEMTQKLISE